MTPRPVLRWERFWFQPVPTSTIAVFRIVYGFVLLVWTASLAPDATAFFSSRGVLPDPVLSGWQVTLFALADSPTAIVLGVGALMVAALCVMVGYHTRLATVVSFVLLVSLRRRNIYVTNGGDSLLRHLGFFLMFAPAGAALSVDRWRASRSEFWSTPLRAPWALRLIQIQVSVVYLFTLWLKAQGERWNGGTAVNDSLLVADLARFRLPHAVVDSLLMANLFTYGTLAAELALAVLIWHRPARPYVIAVGIALHLFIELTFSLGFFSIVLMMSYLAFIPEDAMARAIADVRGRLAGFGRRTRRVRLAAAISLLVGAGCVSAPTAVVEGTAPFITTSTIVAGGDGRLEVGQASSTALGNTIALLDVEDGTSGGKDVLHTMVEACAARDAAGAVGVDLRFFAVQLEDDSIIQPIDPKDAAEPPLRAQRLQPGTCTVGWLSFEVEDAAPSRLVFRSRSSATSWELP